MTCAKIFQILTGRVAFHCNEAAVRSKSFREASNHNVDRVEHPLNAKLAAPILSHAAHIMSAIDE